MKLVSGRLFAFTIIIITSLCVTSESHSQDRLSTYWVRSITRDSIYVQEFRKTADHTIAVGNIAVWDHLLDKPNPLQTVFWGNRDWDLVLLELGFARLKNHADTTSPFAAAQQIAEKSHLGLWASASIDSSTNASRRNLWTRDRIKAAVLLWGGIGTVCVTAFALLKWLLRVLRRRRLPLIFLGLHSSGKSWLWTRLTNPDVTREELEHIERTQIPPRPLKSTIPKPMGRYEVSPVYIDLPGGSPEHHINAILRRPLTGTGLFSREVSVWIILLATTARAVTRSSSREEKIDELFIQQQLGYLNLPIGMLLADRVPKPQMVIIAISKSDLFSEKDARDAEATIGGIFRMHIASVQKACAGRKIPSRVVYCSALEGWNTDVVLRCIESSVFASPRRTKN